MGDDPLLSEDRWPGEITTTRVIDKITVELGERFAMPMHGTIVHVKATEVTGEVELWVLLP